MKMLIVLIVPVPLLVISCASRSTPPVMVESLPPVVVSPVESVRHVEIVRAYHLGRYVDPNQPGLMHEQHPVYRVEAESRWNLIPGRDDSGTGTAMNPPMDSAHLLAPTDDLIVAELNRQKAVTERVMWEATQLAQSYDQMQKVIVDMTAVAKNHTLMTARFGQTEQRVTRMEQELGRLVSPVPPATNEVPTILIDDPDPAKP